MDELGNRDDINIFTKGAHHDQNGPRVNADAIRSDLFTSLERLRTDYIDLYALHRDDPAVPVGVILEALNEHVEAGRIRAFGGSNWTHTSARSERVCREERPCRIQLQFPEPEPSESERAVLERLRLRR